VKNLRYRHAWKIILAKITRRMTHEPRICKQFFKTNSSPKWRKTWATFAQESLVEFRQGEIWATEAMRLRLPLLYNLRKKFSIAQISA